MLVSIAERRWVMVQAVRDAAFRELLRREPRAALRQVTGRDVRAARIEVIEEQPTAWEFVIPADLSGQVLPQAFDERTAIENRVFALLQSEPETIAAICRAPARFLVDRLGIDPGRVGVNVRREDAGQVLLILTQGVEVEELDDELLDLVSAGGSPACNPPVGMDQSQAVRT